MKVYISGPISLGGQADPDSIAARLIRFDMVANIFREKGYEVYNAGRPESSPCHGRACESNKTFPDGSYQHSWLCYMKYHIKNLMDCDVIVMLPDWEQSEGAKLEHHIASKLGFPRYYVDEYGDYTANANV